MVVGNRITTDWHKVFERLSDGTVKWKSVQDAIRCINRNGIVDERFRPD
jgi:phospholipase C